MNPSHDDPIENEVPLTRPGFAPRDEHLNLVDRDLDPTYAMEAEEARTLELTDPALTRAPEPNMTGASLADWMSDGAGLKSGLESPGTLRRGIVGKIQSGQTLYGKYQVLKKLGGGAMGDVWLVRHNTLKSEHALKVIVPNFARNAVALMRFQREFEVMATLRHEHAVTIYDACIDEEGGYIDMEFVDGLTIDAILSTARARADRDPTEPLMPLAWITRILEQLSEVLQTAHDKGIVHRDLKPSNLMLLSGRKPGKEYLKVLDFGIAKVRDDPEGASGRELEESSSKTEGFIGTPSYGSPEQAMSMENLDGRADLYSVGIMLYEFVSGRLPFRGSPLHVMTQNANSPPPPFHETNPKLRPLPELEYAILRVLAKDPNLRPQTARELFDEVREAVEALQSSQNSSAASSSWGDPGASTSLHPEPSTELDHQGDSRTHLSTIEATLVRPRVEPASAKSVVAPRGDLDPVVVARPARTRKWVGLSVLVGFLILASLGVAVLYQTRRPSLVNGNPRSVTVARFEDYWPENFVAVDSSKSEVWPSQVRQTIADRYFNRFADGIYLPDGYSADDPKVLVDGWPAVIVRDGIRFARIEGNKEWTMGAWDADLEPGRSDLPAHPVKLTGFYIQETEVTNGQYEDYLEKTQATRPTEWERSYLDLRKLGRDLARQHPAVNLSRKQAIAFGRSIDAQLPTEAQWEYAARSRGERRRYVWGDAPPPSRMQANVETWDEKTTAPVKSYPSDRTIQGVYDMLGNVQELCRDAFGPYKKSALPEVNPLAVPVGSGLPDYVIRGACFNSIPDDCKLTRRDEHRPETEVSAMFGFRLVVECPDPKKP